jgi:hypothetical protein
VSCSEGLSTAVQHDTSRRQSKWFIGTPSVMLAVSSAQLKPPALQVMGGKIGSIAALHAGCGLGLATFV